MYPPGYTHQPAQPTWQQPQQSKPKLPGITKDFMMTLIWISLSLFVAFCGGLHMHIHAYRYDLTCDMTKCVYRSSDKPPADFPRSDLLGATVVPAARGTGHTLKVRYNSPAGSRFKVEKHLMFTPHGLREGESVLYNDDVAKYVTKTTDSLHINSSHSYTALGAACMLFGLGSAGMCVVLGTWSNENAHRAKKMH
jgi:hypothetical protein